MFASRVVFDVCVQGGLRCLRPGGLRVGGNQND